MTANAQGTDVILKTNDYFNTIDIIQTKDTTGYYIGTYGKQGYLLINLRDKKSYLTEDFINYKIGTLPVQTNTFWDVNYYDSYYILLDGDGKGVTISYDGYNWLYESLADLNTKSVSGSTYKDGMLIYTYQNPGGIIRSTNGGKNWTKQDVASGLMGVSTNGVSVVAIQNGGPESQNGSKFLSSNDVVTWSSVLLPRSGWNTIAYNDIDKKYYAGSYATITNNGSVVSSSDGENWTDEQINADIKFIGSIICVSGYVLITAKENDPTINTFSKLPNIILIKAPDKNTWEKRLLPSPVNSEIIYRLASFDDNKYKSSIAYTKTPTTTTTSPIPTPTPTSPIPTPTPTTPAIAPTPFIQYCGAKWNEIVYSGFSFNDPIKWNRPTKGKDFIAIGQKYSPYRMILTINDGADWRSYPLPYPTNPAGGATLPYIGLEYGQERFVAVTTDPYGKSLTTKIYVSDKIIDFKNSSPAFSLITIEHPSTQVVWKSLAYGNGMFLLCGSGYQLNNYGVFYKSEDGLTWSRIKPVGLKYGYDHVIFVNEYFVLLGQSREGNDIAISKDGINWTTATMPLLGSWRAVAYGLDEYVAIPVNATTTLSYKMDIAVSKDAITWTSRTINANIVSASMTFGNGTFVGVSPDGRYTHVSADGIKWGRYLGVQIGIYPDANDIIINGKLLVASSSSRGIWQSVCEPPPSPTPSVISVGTIPNYFVMPIKQAKSGALISNDYGYGSSDGKSWQKFPLRSGAWLPFAASQQYYSLFDRLTGLVARTKDFLTFEYDEVTFTPYGDSNKIEDLYCFAGKFILMASDNTYYAHTNDGLYYSRYRTPRLLNDYRPFDPFNPPAYNRVKKAASGNGLVVYTVQDIKYTFYKDGENKFVYGPWNANTKSGIIYATNTSLNNWTLVAVDNDWSYDAIAFGNGKFVIAGIEHVAISTDAITWTVKKLPSDIRIRSLLYYEKTKYYYGFSEYGSTIYWSEDGLNWNIDNSSPKLAYMTSYNYGTQGPMIIGSYGNGQLIYISGGNGIWETIELATPDDYNYVMSLAIKPPQ